MLTVWRRAETFDRGKAAVSKWLFTIARNKRIDMLNFEKVGLLMPHVQDLIDSKYETYNKCGLKCALNVLRAFKQPIID